MFYFLAFALGVIVGGLICWFFLNIHSNVWKEIAEEETNRVVELEKRIRNEIKKSSNKR